LVLQKEVIAMKVSKNLFLTGFIAATALSLPAQADNTNKSITLGLEEGPGFLSGGGGTHLQWGGEALYNLLGPLEIGGYINYMSRGTVPDPVNGNVLDGNYLFYGGEVVYDLNAWGLPYASLGARIGLVHNSLTKTLASGSVEENNTTNFSIGPVFNYDIPFGTSWSIGGLANWQINSGSAHNDIAILATLKYYLF
jgi:hypothetical protein